MFETDTFSDVKNLYISKLHNQVRTKIEKPVKLTGSGRQTLCS